MRFDLGLVLLAVTAPPVAAFDTEETVATDVGSVSDNAAGAIAFDGVSHYIAYEKSGDIYLASRPWPAGGWTSEVVSNDAAAQTLPKVVHADNAIVVIWEDARGSHPEIYARRFVDGAWEPETCLSCDAVPSHSPGLAAFQGTWYFPQEEVLAVWVDDTNPSTIVVRPFEGTSWQPAETLSDGIRAAHSPSPFVQDPLDLRFGVLWLEDTPTGNDVLMRRTDVEFDDWGAALSITSLTGIADAVAPLSASAAHCCKGDGQLRIGVNRAAGPSWAVLFDEFCCGGDSFFVGAFPVDVASKYWTSWSRAFGSSGCTFWGLDNRPAPYLTGAGIDVDGDVVLDYTSDSITFDPGTGGLVMQTFAMDPVDYTVPSTGIVAYVRDIDGQLNLVARVGQLPTGVAAVFDDPPPTILIAPEAVPNNVVRLVNAFGGDPLEGRTVRLAVDPPILAAVNLVTDPSLVNELTDEFGVATIALEGGGCYEAPVSSGALVDVTCADVPRFFRRGVRSPDIDGDCIVDESDLDAVRDALGTSDICADIDGSGLVDSGDEDIVLMTLGDQCSTLPVDEPTPTVVRQLRVAPNPMRTLGLIRIEVDATERASVAVVDVQGRVVRDFGSMNLTRGVNHLSWAGEADRGGRVGAGRYFVVVSPTNDARAAMVTELTVVR